MTEISCGTDGAGFFIEASGHSGFAGAGRDIVCAGISALIFAEIDLTREMESAGYIVKRTVIAHDGFLYLHVEPCEGKRELLRGAFAAARAGLRLLAEKYPENVQMEETDGESI